MLFFVGISLALTWSMSSGKHHVKKLLPQYKPSLTHNNIYTNPARDQINNDGTDGQPMANVSGALPPVSPRSHTGKECL